MGFTAIYLHFIWATHERRKMITPAIERRIIEMVYQKSDELKVRVFAVNTVEDHIHIACSFPTTLHASDYVKNIKGTTSYAVNHSTHNIPDEQRFRWQEQYGVLSFGERSLEQIQNYIRRQKEHHAAGGKLIDYFEQI